MTLFNSEAQKLHRMFLIKNYDDEAKEMLKNKGKPRQTSYLDFVSPKEAKFNEKTLLFS